MGFFNVLYLSYFFLKTIFLKIIEIKILFKAEYNSIADNAIIAVDFGLKALSI